MGSLIVVCADKGSPGASTLALLLAATYPTRPLLVEADPAGGDLAQRLFAATGRTHPVGANLLALASDSRKGAHARTVAERAAVTSLGVPLVEGLSNADQQAGLAPLWPSLVAALSASENDVIVDLGRVSATHPGLAVAASAHHILIAVRPHLEELLRLRDRLHHLLTVAGGDTERFVVVVVSPDTDGRRDQDAASQVLANAGLSTVRVGWIPFAPKEVAALFAGQSNRRGYLWRSAATLSAELKSATPNQSAADACSAAASHHSSVGEAAWTTS